MFRWNLVATQAQAFLITRQVLQMLPDMGLSLLRVLALPAATKSPGLWGCSLSGLAVPASRLCLVGRSIWDGLPGMLASPLASLSRVTFFLWKLTPQPLSVISSWYRLSLHLYLNMGAAGWVAGQPRGAEWTDMGSQSMGDKVLGGLGTHDLGGMESRDTRQVHHIIWAMLVSRSETWRERTGQSRPSCDYHGGQGAQEPWKGRTVRCSQY